ncbi:MAG: hypothetical protein M3178_16245 [Pseudomonadota bacterium]|nr:hypothetical protein [Pseudomonadota bacterium]
MPEWLSLENVKAFAGVFATLVASIVATVITAVFARKQVAIASGQLNIANAQKDIAIAQSDIALEKLKYDLFEKRYEIYKTTTNVLEHILSNVDFEKQNSELIRSSFVKMDESRFFFDENMHAYLASIEGECQAFFDLLIKRDTFRNDDESWRRLATQVAEKMKKLKEIHRELPAKFANALAFKKLTTPSA